jgi:hypothetical protein
VTRLCRLAVLSFVLVATPAAAQSKSFERTVPLTPGGVLALDAMKGSVKLSSWDRPEVEIRARVEADRPSWGSDQERRAAVEATTVDVEATSTGVRVRSNYAAVAGSRGWFGESVGLPKIHYEIRAPRQLDLRLDVDRSPLDLTGFDGRVDLDADRSVVTAADLSGALRLSIDRGGMSTFRNFRGSLIVDADRTDLRLDLVHLDAESRIEVNRGDFDVALAERQGVALEAQLSRRADFESARAIQSKRRSRRGISGAINGGGPRLVILADRGRVRLR